MARRTHLRGRRWAVILAGGEGNRLAQYTESRFGERRPKQYCAFQGDETMFELTQRRAADLVGRDRLVSVIGRGHARYLGLGRRPGLSGLILEQPQERDTAAGVFLPLCSILAYDPEAAVVIFPSDHFVRPYGLFLECMETALQAAERLPGRLVLAGAAARSPETEYGWIEPGPRLAETPVRAVLSFHEKPDERKAALLQAGGCLWNTFIIAAKAKTLWDIGAALEPGLVERFELLRRAVGHPQEAEVLASVYGDMPRVNFSSGLLERCPERAAVLTLRGVEWSDWGRAERIEETLSALIPR